jgi:hypothetical protein
MKTYKVIVDDYGTKHWYHNDKRHREDGPAIEWANGDKHWYHNNKLHREDGPAIELINGTKHWYHKGKLHREDGPAIERTNGDKEWHINGKELTEAEFNARTKSCNGKIVEIDGKKYKLQEVE